MSPRLDGPNPTSAATVGMNNWSSGSWKTMPTRRRISTMLVRSTSSPAILTVPARAVRMPFRCRTSVVLPAPLGPSRATRSPGWTWRSMPFRALVPIRVGELDAPHLDGGNAHRVTHPTVAMAAQISTSTPAANHWRATGAGAAVSGITPVYPRDSMAR